MVNGNLPRIVIVGGGAIGLSIARAVSSYLRFEVFLLEKSQRAGTVTTSRNSGVIHAGLYYPPHSLKNRHCLLGKKSLVSYIQERKLPLNICGKLVVATSPEEHVTLDAIAARCESNGLKGLKTLINPSDVKTYYEPLVECTKALFVPETAVFDVHSFVSSLEHDCEENGVTIVYNCKFENAFKEKGNMEEFIVSTSQGELKTTYFINAAGLEAPVVASRIKEYPRSMVPKMYFAKGNYFKLMGSSKPFSRLVYPIPQEGGLGVHATIDAIDGSSRFGPDVEWLKGSIANSRNDSESADIVTDDEYLFHQVPNFEELGVYCVEEERKNNFYSTVRLYFPSLPDEALSPDYSGIRPKLVRPGSSSMVGLEGQRDLQDFVIEDSSIHSVPNLINLFGIESPGLTSSLSIANHVQQLLK